MANVRRVENIKPYVSMYPSCWQTDSTMRLLLISSFCALAWWSMKLEGTTGNWGKNFKSLQRRKIVR